MRQRIEDVKFAAANFRREYPLATGTLASPPLPTWDTELKAIAAEATPQTARQLAQRLSSVSDDIERHLNGYAAADGLSAVEERIRAQVAELEQSPSGVASANIITAREKLVAANQNAAAGNLGTDEILADVEMALTSGRELLAVEREQRERAEQRARLIRRTVLATLSVYGPGHRGPVGGAQSAARRRHVGGSAETGRTPTIRR